MKVSEYEMKNFVSIWHVIYMSAMIIYPRSVIMLENIWNDYVRSSVFLNPEIIFLYDKFTFQQ